MRILIAATLALAASGGTVLAQHTGSLPSPPAASGKPAKPAPTAHAVRAETIADCMRLWDKGTHMTKQQWARTCERIQTRLENLKIENLNLMGIGMRKKSGAGPQRGIDSSSRSN